MAEKLETYMYNKTPVKYTHFRARYRDVAALLALSLLLFLPPAVCAEEKAQNDVVEYSPPAKGFWKSISDFFLPHIEGRNVIYEKESEIFLISVEDDESGRRHLVFSPNKGSQGIILPDDPDKIIPNFMKYSFLAFSAMNKQPEKVLFIGLGAGIMPRFINNHYPDCEIDVVEIDKALLLIAKKYFGFRKNKNINVIIEDGRFFVNRSEKTYDLIVIDVYNATEIPFQFTTKEFFRRIQKLLNNNGVMVANIANFGKENFIASEFKTVSEVFDNMAVVICPRDTNYVLFASDKSLFKEKAWKKKSIEADKKNKWHFKLAPFLETRMNDEKLNQLTDNAKILTDDFAPVNDMD